MASKGQRWVVDSGILRKKIQDEEPPELLVFGYSCKLFRDDEKAKLVDQGKHLIPWMGDSTHKIDRYDARGALGDLRMHEPPSGGYDLRTILTEDEYKMEQICDEERYRSLYNNEVEEAINHEEEIKRLHQALGSDGTYNQVGFNYDEEKKTGEDSQSPKQSEEDEDEPFVPDPEFEIPENIVTPETQKLNAIITKTALFISQQGGQMEVLIKAKQADNPQFSFLSLDGELHPYYKHLLEAIKSGKFNPEKEPEKTEMDTVEEESEGEDDESYLHPSLATSLKVEAAPSIPSINYKPSEDCAYSMLVNKITGKPSLKTQQPEVIPPPPMPPVGFYHPMQGYTPFPIPPQQYAHGPVLYSANGHAIPVPMPQVEISNPVPSSNDQTPHKDHSPLVPYGPTPPKPLNRPSFIVPPADIQIIIDKMASYVAKNGRDFEIIVRSKGDPRFNFLELSHQYHGYYAHKLTIYEGGVNPRVLTEEELLQKQELQEEKQKKLEELQKKQQRMEEVQKRVKMIQEKKKEIKTRQSPNKQITTVSFSIKKPKEGDTTVIEKRNALPQEESDDEKNDDKKETNSRPESPEHVEEVQVVKIEKEQPSRQEKLSKSEKKSVKKPSTPCNETDIVDLTEDIFETCQKEIQDSKEMDDKVRDKIAAVAKEKLAASKEKQLQMERRKKAAMFLSQIQKSNLVVKKVATPATPAKPVTIAKQEPTAIKENSKKDSVTEPLVTSFPPSPSKDVDIEEIRVCTNSLMSRLRGTDRAERIERIERIEKIDMFERIETIDISSKRSRNRSRSRSSSVGYSEKHRSHKKHKKKKSSHRSYRESLSSSSRSHKSKKSKKSSSRHRTRSRSPRKRHTSSRRRKESSSSSDSDSTTS